MEKPCVLPLDKLIVNVLVGSVRPDIYGKVRRCSSLEVCLVTVELSQKISTALGRVRLFEKHT